MNINPKHSASKSFDQRFLCFRLTPSTCSSQRLAQLVFNANTRVMIQCVASSSGRMQAHCNRTVKNHPPRACDVPTVPSG